SKMGLPLGSVFEVPVKVTLWLAECFSMSAVPVTTVLPPLFSSVNIKTCIFVQTTCHRRLILLAISLILIAFILGEDAGREARQHQPCYRQPGQPLNLPHRVDSFSYGKYPSAGSDLPPIIWSMDNLESSAMRKRSFSDEETEA